MRSKAYLGLILLSFLVLTFSMTFVKSVTLAEGTNLTANNGASVYVDSPILRVDQAVVENNAVALYNMSYINGELTLNQTGLANWTSGSIRTSQFPRITASSDKVKTIPSSLTNISNTAFTVNVGYGYNCNFLSVVWAAASSPSINPSYSCNPTTNRLTVTGVNVTTGTNTLTINYLYPTPGTNSICSSYAEGLGKLGAGISTFILILGALMIIAGAVFLVYTVKGEGLESFGTMQYITVAVIGLGVVIFIVFASLIATDLLCRTGL